MRLSLDEAGGRSQLARLYDYAKPSECRALVIPSFIGSVSSPMHRQWLRQAVMLPFTQAGSEMLSVQRCLGDRSAIRCRILGIVGS